jgi:hypothetical protein
MPESGRLLEFNEVVIKACESDPEERYSPPVKCITIWSSLSTESVGTTPSLAPALPIELVLGCSIDSFTPDKCKTLMEAISKLLEIDYQIKSHESDLGAQF